LEGYETPEKSLFVFGIFALEGQGVQGKDEVHEGVLEVHHEGLGVVVILQEGVLEVGLVHALEREEVTVFVEPFDNCAEPQERDQRNEGGREHYPFELDEVKSRDGRGLGCRLVSYQGAAGQEGGASVGEHADVVELEGEEGDHLVGDSEVDVVLPFLEAGAFFE